MIKNYSLKNYSPDKIVFLAIFAVSILAAQFIVINKSKVLLSSPIKLRDTGLSIVLPQGNGWECSKQWQYQSNGAILTSIFSTGNRKTTALAQCQYVLASSEADTAATFEQRAQENKGEIKKSGQIEKSSIVFKWVHIKNENILLDLFLATACLPDNRQLNIEVYQSSLDKAFAQKIFDKILENLEFENNQLAQFGSEIINVVKDSGINSFLFKKSKEDTFLVTDSAGKAIGFIDNMLTVTSLQDIQITGAIYIKGRLGSEETEYFKTNNNLGTFLWKNKISGPAGRKNYEMVLDENGSLNIKKFKLQPENILYQITPSMIPEVLLDFVLIAMLESNHEKIAVDVIETNGDITTALISKTDAEDFDYALKVEFLNNRNTYETVYFDKHRKIQKELLYLNAFYNIDRSNVKNIMKLFPEQAEYLQHKYEIQQENKI